MADQPINAVYFKNTIFTILLLILFTSVESVGQSEFYKSLSSTTSTIDLLPEEEFNWDLELNLGNRHDEKTLDIHDVQKINLGAVIERKSYQENALSKLLNKYENIKTLQIPSNISKNSDYTILDLDYDQLNYIENIIIEWNTNLNYNSIFAKLNLTSKLKHLTIKCGDNTQIEMTSSFRSLISKLSGLCLINTTILPTTQEITSKNLTTLVIKNYNSDGDQIRYLLQYFSSCKNIKEIIFDRKAPIDFNVIDYLNQYKKLKVLDLDCKSFAPKSIPFDSIVNFPKIESLCLMNASHCSHDGIHNFRSLKKLKLLSGYKYIELSNDVYKLKNIESLSYSTDSVNPQISNFKKLKKLYIKGRFDTFPESFYSLKKLKHLEVDCHNLDSLFDHINVFKNLETLILKSGKIKEIPESIATLKKLKHLDIQTNHGVESIPKNIGELKNLEVFKITESTLRTIPKSFINLKKLKTLELCGSESAAIDLYNGITFLERDSFYENLLLSISSFNQLERLKLSYNRLTEDRLISLLNSIKPDVLQNLYLDLSHCWIQTLPENIWNNIQIKFLNLSDNEIKDVPKSFLLSEIDQFDLAGNHSSVRNHYPNKKWSYFWGLLLKKLDPRDIKNKAKVIDFLDYTSFNVLDNTFIVDIAFQIDSMYSINTLPPAKLANYYFVQKNYPKSNKLYKSAKESFVNPFNPDAKYIPLSNDWIRFALSLYISGNTSEFRSNVKEMHHHSDKSIENYKIKCECKALGYLQKSDRILLGILLNNFDKELATKVWEPKISQLRSVTINNNCKTSNYLNLLELYLIAEDYDSFDSLYVHTILNIEKDTNDEIILEYLKIAKDLIEGIDCSISIKKLKRTLEKRAPINTNWNTTYIEMWAILSDNPNASKLQDLNRMIQPSLSFTPIPIF